MAEQAKENLILDFLYVDQDRISSILSQLNDYGALVQMVSQETAVRAKTEEVGAHGKGTIGVASGQLDVKDGYSASLQRQRQQLYDARWLNTLNFLDEATARGMINKTIENAPPGSIVRHSGHLSVRDLGQLKSFWKLPSFQAAARSGVDAQAGMPRQQVRAKNRTSTKTKKTEPDGLELFLEMSEHLPHTVQAIFQGEKARVWSILREDSLRIRSSDMMLNYGSNIPGVWSVIGIVDALPGGLDQQAPDFSNFTGDESAAVTAILDAFVPVFRSTMGRPSNCFGVTPLVVYRTVGANSGEQA
ncbi:hypothetical protein [uncultured Paracoccus sp.]|uniref:DUF6414 family protein n=1 Tax=uncultured Paracoccus sp. TaxID=189685 RepID=UPI00262BB674|nr:hypothetical protein [uncultured Paracoccus sp.]